MYTNCFIYTDKNNTEFDQGKFLTWLFKFSVTQSFSFTFSAAGVLQTIQDPNNNTVQWTAETLNSAFAQYPLLPENSPALQIFAGLALSATGLDTLTDFAALVSGRAPLTGRELTSHDLLITWLAFSIPLVSASMMHGFADDAAELMAELRPLREVECSFDAETPVTTEEGSVAISDVDVGDKVLAWDEALAASGYYTVTAVWAHEDSATVLLTIDRETI